MHSWFYSHVISQGSWAPPDLFDIVDYTLLNIHANKFSQKFNFQAFKREHPSKVALAGTKLNFYIARLVVLNALTISQDNITQILGQKAEKAHEVSWMHFSESSKKRRNFPSLNFQFLFHLLFFTDRLVRLRNFRSYAGHSSGISYSERLPVRKHYFVIQLHVTGYALSLMP